MRVVRQSKNDLLKAAETKDIVFFGAGAMALRLLSMMDIAKNVRFICDNKEHRIGTKLCGINIVHPEKLKTMDVQKTAVVITSRNYQKEIADQICQIGDFDLYFARVLVNEMLEHVAWELFDNQDMIAQVEELLIDEISRKSYKEIVGRRMVFGECDCSDIIVPGDTEYVLPQMFAEKAPEEEVIVDCGAYVGDTVELFYKHLGKRIKRIWALECGHKQLQRLEERVARMQNLPDVPEIKILPYAVSDHKELVRFYQLNSLDGSFIEKNREFIKNTKYDREAYTVETDTLDHLLPETEPVTLIKMDIEGSEYQALLGAAKLIQRYKPKLAISIYHWGKDYFRLALLIKELVPEYKIAIRHHKRTTRGTNLYAWI